MAFFWEGNDPENEGKITYAELLVEVSKFANVLKEKGVKKVRNYLISLSLSYRWTDSFHLTQTFAN